MSGRRVAILHDSPDFGGHERAFLTWLPALVASPEIEALEAWVPRGNVRLGRALAALQSPKLAVTPHPFLKGPAEPLRAPFRRAYGRAARAFVAGRQADTVLLLQGRIENLATPLLWLPQGLDVISYLPMAHSGVEMGRPAAAAALTDGLKRLYYRRPRRFIVPSEAVAAQVRRAGGRSPIHVVENVPSAASAQGDRLQARKELGLPADAHIALYMGRFDLYQKGLDWLLRDLKREAPALGGWRFVFVGGGPQADALKALVGEGGVKGQVVEWTDRPSLYLSACDILLLPSRFEGVPLVMLEALQQSVPVLASDIDVFRHYLPTEALRNFAQPVDLPASLEKLTSPGELQAYRNHATSVSGRLDVLTSRSRFTSAVLARGQV